MKGAAGDITLSPARLLSPGQKWAFAELALRHAEQMLAIMVDIAVNGTSEAVRLAAADKVIDRAMGKAPAHIDITAMRHTDIVYQSAEELRAEFRKAPRHRAAQLCTREVGSRLMRRRWISASIAPAAWRYCWQSFAPHPC